MKALDFYIERRFSSFNQSLNIEKSMSENLEALFELHFSASNNLHRTNDCFLTNSIVELAGNEPNLYDYATDRYEQVHLEIHRFFEAYVDSDQIEDGIDAEDLTDLFMTFRRGLTALSRNRHPEQALKRSINTFLISIKSLEKI